MEEQNQASREQPKTLGLLRWVQVAFLATFAALFWLLDKAVNAVWSMLAEPDPLIASAVSALVAGVVVWRLYRHPQINRLAHEVVAELAKVTWPSRRETSTNTVVVIITSIIAAVILGTFDAIWAAITDLIYKV